MIEFAVRRPISILMIGLGILVLGIISIKKIPMTFMPNIVSQEFQIKIGFRGASAEDIEKQIAIPVERGISTVPGLLSMNSVSQKDSFSILLKFRNEIDQIETISMLKDRIELLGLPEGSSKARVIRLQENQEPVVRMAIRPKSNQFSAVDNSVQLKSSFIRNIERLPGVATAQLLGDLEKYIRIEVSPEKLLAYGLTPASVSDAIQVDNKFYNSGEIIFDGLQTPIRIGHELDSLESLQKVIIKREGDRQIFLSDVANIQLLESKPNFYVRVNQTNAFVIEVKKEAEANSVSVARLIDQEIKNYTTLNPNQFEIEILTNQGEEIERAIHNVSDSVRDGALLAGLVIFLLVQSGWPTFVIVVAMPLSLFVTFILMHFLGITFNLMSLAGLALGVGMLVDNATVVLDSISLESLTYRDIKEAALVGAKKVSEAITFSTFSTIAVFGPLAFIPGVIGQIFRDVAATVCFSIFASLIVALLFIPMLCAYQERFQFNLFAKKNLKLNNQLLFRFEKRKQNKLFNFIKIFSIFLGLWLQKLKLTLVFICLIILQAISHWFGPAQIFLSQYLRRVFQSVNKAYSALEEALKAGIEKVFSTPQKSLLFSIATLCLGLLLIFTRGSELFPEDPSNLFRYSLEFKPGSTESLVKTQLHQLEEKLAKISGVETVTSLMGTEPGLPYEIMIRFKEIPRADSLLIVGSVFSSVPDLIFQRKKAVLISDKKPIRVEIFSEDQELLNSSTQQVLNVFKSNSNLFDVESSLKPKIKEISIQFSSAKLGLLGIDPQQIIAPLKSFLKGQAAGLMRLQSQDLKLQIEARSGAFDGLDQIKYFPLLLDEGRKSYVSQVADVEERELSGAILHHGKKRYHYIEADALNGEPQKSALEIKSQLEKIFQKSHVEWQMAGQDAERKESAGHLMVAIGLSVFLIFLMLASQYESLTQPLVVLCAVPFCFLGMGIFLWLFQLKLSAVVFVGFIILVGSSVNTSIVMVDFANQFVVLGDNLRLAITKATQKRLKPILITTLSNLFALIPMALAAGEKGSALQQPLAVTILGGHLSSTFLTVLVVPLIYVKLTKKESKSCDKMD